MSNEKENAEMFEDARGSAETLTKVEAVSVKPPPFWRDDVELWFNQLEEQFELANVTRNQTKYSHAVSCISSDILRVVRDVVVSPPSPDKYDRLRSALISRLSVSDNEQLSRLMNDLSLGDRRPSQFLREMRQLGGDKVSEKTLRMLWLQRLPEHMQTVLACNPEGTLEVLAASADSIAEIVSRQSVCAATVQPSPPVPPPQVTRAPPQGDSSVLLERLARLEGLVESMHRRMRSSSRRGSRSRSRGPSSSSASHNASWCWYHQRWGTMARSCKPPCTFSTASSSAIGGGPKN